MLLLLLLLLQKKDVVSTIVVAVVLVIVVAVNVFVSTIVLVNVKRRCYRFQNLSEILDFLPAEFH